MAGERISIKAIAQVLTAQMSEKPLLELLEVVTYLSEKPRPIELKA